MIRPGAMRRRLRTLRDAQAGVSAVEFALIAPMMLALFFGLVEAGNAVIACRRTNHASASLSDLVAQTATISSAGMSDVFAAGGQMLSPMSTAKLKMKVTSVTLQSNGKITVDWSKGSGLSPDTAGAVYAMPANMLTTKGDSAIIGTAQYTLVQATHYVLKNDLSYVKVSYSKPRNGSQVTYTS